MADGFTQYVKPAKSKFDPQGFEKYHNHGANRAESKPLVTINATQFLFNASLTRKMGYTDDSKPKSVNLFFNQESQEIMLMFSEHGEFSAKRTGKGVGIAITCIGFIKETIGELDYINISNYTYRSEPSIADKVSGRIVFDLKEPFSKKKRARRRRQ